MATRRPLVVGVAGVALVIAGLAFVWLRANSFSDAWDPPAPGTIVAERAAPDSSLVATVRAADRIGHYVFELRKPNSSDVVARQEIATPVGYHPQRVSVEWDSNHRATAVIDHDFGENPSRFAIVF